MLFEELKIDSSIKRSLYAMQLFVFFERLKRVDLVREHYKELKYVGGILKQNFLKEMRKVRSTIKRIGSLIEVQKENNLLCRMQVKIQKMKEPMQQKLLMA